MAGDLPSLDGVYGPLRYRLCVLARQGSHVLTLLLHVQRGSSSGAGRDTFAAVMPYFGRVKISFPINGIAAITPEEDANTSLAPPGIATGNVRFSGWSDGHQDFAMTTDFDEEPVGDWSAAMAADIELDYDWAHFFDD
jgi:hypothetical protein